MTEAPADFPVALLQRSKSNDWTNELQATLKTANGLAYLAHECRSEQVDHRVFMPAGHLVFFIKGWDGNWFLKTGTETIPARPFRKGRLSLRQAQHVASEVMTCPATVEEVAPLDAPCIPIRELYMTVTTDTAELFCPVHYLNFGKSNEYIQPLAGHVLWHEDGQYRVGYIGVHHDGGRTTIRLALSAITSTLRMHNTGKSGILARLVPGWLQAESYVGIRELKGSVRFHRVRFRNMP